MADWLIGTDVIRLFNVSRQWLSKWKRRGRIRVQGEGWPYLYRRSDVEECMRTFGKRKR